VRAAASKRDREGAVRRRLLVDEALLHLNADEELERVDAVLRAGLVHHLADGLAVLVIRGEDRSVAPRRLLEEAIDVGGHERGRVEQRLVAEERVLVERRLGDRGGVSSHVLVGVACACAPCEEEQAEQPERRFRYHVGV
jgi:hypothetical protein